MTASRFRAAGLEDPKSGPKDFVGFFSFMAIIALIVSWGIFYSSFSSYPLSLLDPYGWLVIVIFLLAGIGWEFSYIMRRNYMTIYEIDFVNNSRVGGEREITYVDLLKRDQERYEKRFISSDVKTFPNEPLYWNSPLGGPIRVKGTEASLKIVSREKSARDLLLAFNSSEEMEKAHAYLCNGEGNDPEPNFISKPTLEGIMRAPRFTWIFYPTGFSFNLFIVALIYYFDSNWVLTCQAGFPSSFLTFSCVPLWPILVLVAMIAAMIRKLIHDHKMSQRLMEVAHPVE